MRLQPLARQAVVVPLRIYRVTLSPLLPPSCRFEPSCSSYAIGAITSHGIVRGGWLAVRRLARCHPCSAGGNDPVPTVRT